MKYRFAALVMALVVTAMTALPCLAETPVVFGPDLTGAYVYPEGADEADALYIYRYRYPQIAGESDLAAMINTTYLYTAEDALGFEAPMLATELMPGDPQKVVDISYEVTCLTESHLSLKITKRVTVAGTETLVTSGHVIALTGSGMGRIVNLPVMLGLLDPDETDEWLLTRQTRKADTYAREIVWARLQSSSGGAYTLYDDLTFEEFEQSFYPEEDFYLSESGDLCFFLQPGVIAPEEQGEVSVIVTVRELLDAM